MQRAARTRRRLHVALPVTSIVSTALPPPRAHAAPVTRTLTGLLWSDPTSWSTNGLPAAGDDAVVTSKLSIVDTPSLSIRHLTLAAPVDMYEPALGTHAIAVTGDIRVEKARSDPSGPWGGGVMVPMVLLVGTHVIDAPAETVAGFSDLSGPGDVVKTGDGRSISPDSAMRSPAPVRTRTAAPPRSRTDPATS